MVKNIGRDNEVRESAAKLDELTNHLEGSETIPKGSTSENPNSDGSACPRPDNAEGEEIVQRREFYKNYLIEKANNKFNNKFDYSKVEYTRIKDKVTIICPIHGEFQQSFEKHIESKYGCPKCAHDLKVPNPVNHPVGEEHPAFVTLEKFLELANKKYNNKFTYITEGLNWTGLTTTKIKIVCPIHGEFEALAVNHLMNGNVTGCPKCGNKKRAKSKTIPYDEVLNEIYDMYGDKYIIPEENREIYVNKRTKIKIICPIHGVFYKSVNKFLHGQECHQCIMKRNKLNSIYTGGYYSDEWFIDNPDFAIKPATLYYIRITCNNEIIYKIGITIQPLKNRFKSIKADAKRKGDNINIEIINQLFDTLQNVYNIEQEILKHYKEYRIIKKWSTELFNVDIYNFIKDIF